MDLGITGKKALVLGSSRGLGLGVAAAFGAEGVDVMIAARNEDRLAEAASRLREDHAAGGRVESQVCDLAEPAAVETLAEIALKSLGQVDILVNNTGGPPPGPVSGITPEVWSAQFETMILSVMRLTARLLPDMRTRRWGRILTIVSSGVIQPIPLLGISNTLHPALVGWSKTLANEVAKDGVTVNCIAPGRIHTDRTDEIDQAAAERLGISLDEVAARSRAMIPTGRYGDVEEFSAAVAFLASARASYVTGSIMRVDGGLIQSS